MSDEHLNVREAGRAGDAAPGTGGGVYDFFNVAVPAFNNGGDAAFLMPIAGASVSDGIFVDLAGIQSPVALKGAAAPGTGAGGTFDSFESEPAMNDSGKIVFRADVAGGSTASGVSWTTPVRFLR